MSKLHTTPKPPTVATKAPTPPQENAPLAAAATILEAEAKAETELQKMLKAVAVILASGDLAPLTTKQLRDLAGAVRAHQKMRKDVHQALLPKKGDTYRVYSFEGTREMQTLIVGRAITGFSAFV